MVRKSEDVLEVEIRDTQTHYSDDDGSDPEFTVVRDDFPSTYTSMSDVRVYVNDDHDAAIDVIVQHTGPNDDTYEATSNKNTISITSGQDGGTAKLDGPLGRVRFEMLASTAPTSGSLTITVLGLGLE